MAAYAAARVLLVSIAVAKSIGKTGGIAKRSSKMRFTKAHHPQQYNICVVVQKLEPEEALNRHAIDLFWPAPGKLVDSFYHQEAGAFDPADRSAITDWPSSPLARLAR
jgi:hypothetical protein